MKNAKWKKLGLIFNPIEHKLPNGCHEFAQSPQTLVFDDFVRIYFSTRKKEENSGKYLSHIAFVDFDKSFKYIKEISKETIIKLGNLGCFDEHGIFPINPFRNGDKIFAYTCGWSRRKSVSVETSVGLAISDDNGYTFKKIGEGPILTSSLHEPMLVGDAFVRRYNEIFHMWYIFGTGWKYEPDDETPARIYKIAHATSIDGISWKKEEGKQIISDILDKHECQALPSVIKVNNQYHMYFCYRYATNFRNDKDRGYRIGYAYSNNLIDWIRDDDNVGIELSKEGWDSEMMCYPHVFECNNEVYMLYNGNAFGKHGFGLAVLDY
jgi:hypothetical protein